MARKRNVGLCPRFLSQPYRMKTLSLKTAYHRAHSPHLQKRPFRCLGQLGQKRQTAPIDVSILPQTVCIFSSDQGP
eukprot:10403845-Ditylum_brightwellii.AAC.1